MPESGRPGVVGEPGEADAVRQRARQARADAAHAVRCLALDPAAIGGALLRTDLAGAQDVWLEWLRRRLPDSQAVRRVPAHVDDERLLGGIDLAATLRSGRAVHARGLLEEADGGVIVLSQAERLGQPLAARIAATLDRRTVSSVRGAMRSELPARFGVIALDSGVADEHCPAALSERLAVHLDLRGLALDDQDIAADERDGMDAARARLRAVHVDADALRALCAVACRCGILSLRAPWLALQLARASAALAGRTEPDGDDLQFAARVVLAPRAVVMPDAPAAEPPAEPASADASTRPPDEPDSAPAEPADDARADAGNNAAETLEDSVVEAARAAIPDGLLQQLTDAGSTRRRSGSAGRSGVSVMARRRGRPAGSRAGVPRHGTRLDVVATLRSAAPWQRVRRAQADSSHRRVHVRTADFHVRCYRQRTETVTVFALDASGSSALHRLAEAKGAIELLLADCYVRRDQVAVLAFRGRSAELLIPPTRSLVRVKRSLAGLAGGGTTPLAAGLDAARLLAGQVQRHGQTPLLVVLSDGHANVARDGRVGRVQAAEDALLAARALRAGGLNALLIDTAPRPQELARRIAEAMGARYLPMPYVDAQSLATAVQRAG